MPAVATEPFPKPGSRDEVPFAVFQPILFWVDLLAELRLQIYIQLQMQFCNFSTLPLLISSGLN